MFYVTYSDDVHDGPSEQHESLFEATCSYYELIPLLEEDEIGELGEWKNGDEMEGFLFSMPEDRR
jgi:hypothetical protein